LGAMLYSKIKSQNDVRDGPLDIWGGGGGGGLGKYPETEKIQKKNIVHNKPSKNLGWFLKS
jgi:hypothetical protein